MTTAGPSNAVSFRYHARAADGRDVRGTVEAAALADASAMLAAMNLTVLDLQPAAPVAHARPLRRDDFLAFNEQLALLANAGLPVEAGLRLIADDIGRGRLANTARAIADEMQNGQSLAEAVEAHRKQFPPLYGRLIDAGIRSGNLGGLLLNMGRHLALVNQLRAKLWATLTYPAVLLIGYLVVFGYISVGVMPLLDITASVRRMKFNPFSVTDQYIYPSPLAQFVILVGGALKTPEVQLSIIIAIAALILGLGFVRATKHRLWISERILLGIPLIGYILKNNLIARWCDALSLAINAGLDLPAAIDIATDAVSSPACREDGTKMKDAVALGRPIGEGFKGCLLPAAVPMAMDIAQSRGNMAETLATFATSHQQRAQQRLAALPAIILPIVYLVMATLFVLLALAMFSAVRFLTGN